MNGKLSEWAMWSKCDKGKAKRIRQCNNPVPRCGGTPCEGDTYQQKECTEPTLPGKEKLASCIQISVTFGYQMVIGISGLILILNICFSLKRCEIGSFI